ncbi:LINE-1 retrotransposable element ORF2 protein [Labeo rohita]|uniref:LINE-1 retrotransposable element ORF2 protein n=1 Tax=Labeo rohita TaxID=84645 RepID=A0ABQ8MAX6_LABRO|nr:LINE-1 retrotransposable element ORF2 protein [Labeo rohita]
MASFPPWAPVGAYTLSVGRLQQIQPISPMPGKVLNRELLERMKEAVDAKLQDHQAGFCRYRSCIDQIASLRIIVEQHCGVLKKFISLIKCTYQDVTCKVAHAGQMSDSFEVRTGVRQGCLLSPFLFLLVIDWIMKTTTASRNNGIQWTPWTQLEDLDFADDLALLLHNHNQMQDKTTRLATTSARTGLVINRRKTELMKINTTVSTPVTVGGEPIQEVESFVYLGSIVDTQGGHRPKCHSQNWQSAISLCHVKEHLGVKGDHYGHKTVHLQFQRQIGLTLWIRDLEDDQSDAAEDTDILQHLSEAHLQNQVARQDQTHIEETSLQHHAPGLKLESTGKAEEGPTQEQLGVRRRLGVEADWDQLDGGRKDSPEP